MNQASTSEPDHFVPAARIKGFSGRVKLSSNGGHSLQPCVIASPIIDTTARSAAGKSSFTQPQLYKTTEAGFVGAKS